jgi:7-cyano-7-deazaguanine synthase
MFQRRQWLYGRGLRPKQIRFPQVSKGRKGGKIDCSKTVDCRDDTLKALRTTLWLGMDHRFVIHTPLMWRDKKAIWELARKLGGTAFVELVHGETHSCHRGDREHRHPWGYGCGDCPACARRRAGCEAFSAVPNAP